MEFISKLLFKLGPIAAMFYMGANGSEAITANLGNLTEIVGVIRTQMEVGSISDAIYQEYRYDHKFPRNFEAFLRKNVESKDENRDVTKDYWGTPFKLEVGNDEFYIRSCGPDTSCGTEDDIVAIKRNINRYGAMAK
ncbi:MAG: hypothetical protein Kow0090_07260 [Myxococcota bacterium]